MKRHAAASIVFSMALAGCGFRTGVTIEGYDGEVPDDGAISDASALDGGDLGAGDGAIDDAFLDGMTEVDGGFSDATISDGSADLSVPTDFAVMSDAPSVIDAGRPDASTDAGVLVDAGRPDASLDAGVVSDASVPSDASRPDASLDAGVVSDASVPTDASRPDAAADAAVLADAGVGFDFGIPSLDGGFGPTPCTTSDQCAPIGPIAQVCWTDIGFCAPRCDGFGGGISVCTLLGDGLVCDPMSGACVEP